MKPLRLKWLTVNEVKQLAADPQNWRKHPEDQARGLIDTIAKIESMTDDNVAGRGWNDPLTFNERLGILQDGHLRANKSTNYLPRQMEKSL